MIGLIFVETVFDRFSLLIGLWYFRLFLDYSSYVSFIFVIDVKIRLINDVVSTKKKSQRLFHLFENNGQISRYIIAQVSGFIA